MIQNLKVDIIYHSTSSDFEMEFNLCGCCRMRLLSDKTNDKKSFVKALARDVARSRVIIACGPIFGDDGLISVVGTAIGTGVALCDNKTYGINSDEPINIINGSTPLVTPDGYFGGCIIESGPQTIILLTENRTFRKAIMQNLIHPYIEEISYIPPKATEEQPESEPEKFETAVAENEDYVITDEEEAEPQPEEELALATDVADEHNIEFIMDEAPEESTQESSDALPTDETSDTDDSANLLMYTEVETKDEIKSRYENPYEPSESDKMFIALPESDDDTKENEKKSRKNKKGLRGVDVAIIILVCLLLLAVLALVYFLVFKPMSMGVNTGQYIKEIFGLVSSSTSV